MPKKSRFMQELAKSNFSFLHLQNSWDVPQAHTCIVLTTFAYVPPK